ncbi:MAG: helix-turn-helix transcriptional regulator [Halioglobus sp.]
MASPTLQQTQQLLAVHIKTLRKGADLSQEALAHEAEIDRTYISQLERALVNPSLAVLVRIADVLGVNVTELLEPV